MEKTNLGSKLLLALMILTLVLSTVNLAGNRRTQEQKHKEYMELLAKERAQELDALLLEFETAGNALAKNMMSALDNPYGMKEKKAREEYLDIVKPLMESTHAQVPYGFSFYMHFNPLLVDPTAGLTMKYDEKTGRLQKGSVINLDAYKSTELAYVGWYYVTLERGEPIWMESYQHDNMDEYKISYLMPLYRNDAVVGVLGMDMHIDTLFEAANQLGLSDTAKVYITDKSGNLLSRDDKEMDEGTQYTYTLRNGMSLVLVEKSKKQASSWYEKVLLFAYIIALCILVGFIIRTRVERTKGFSDAGRHVLLVRFGLWVALAVLLVVQVSFLIYCYGEVEKLPKVKTKAKNEYTETLRVVGDADLAPYSYEDKNGKYSGHNIEVVNALANRMKVNVEYELMPYEKARYALTTGEADILLGFEALSNETNILASPYIVDDSYVIYGRDAISGVMDLYDKKIAVISGNMAMDIYGLEKNTVKYGSYEEAFDSVMKGNTDYVIARRAVAQEVIRENDYDLIQVFDMMDSKVSLGVLSKNKDLAERISVAVEELRVDGTLDDLQTKWVSRSNGIHGFQDILAAHIYFFLITFILLVACAAGLVVSHVKRLDEQTKAELKSRSEIDHLTQIYNRQAGEERIRELIKKRTRGMFCLIDIDKFKSINDRFGHSVGDKVLSEMAECLQRAYKDPSVILRFGGDEFAFFIPDVADENEGREWVNRLFEYVDAIIIRELQERRVEISVGAYLYDGKSDIDFMDVYKYADVALYDSKDVLGNYVTF